MDLLSLTRDQLATELERLGEARYRASQLCAWIYEQRAESFQEMSNLPTALRAQLGASHTLRPLTKIGETGSMDTTRKFLFQLQDGRAFELGSYSAHDEEVDAVAKQDVQQSEKSNAP